MSYELRADRAQMVAAFWRASSDALFDQKTIAAVLSFTEAWCERCRWAGNGPPFIKIGRCVRYRKSDVLQWIDGYPLDMSTTPATPRAAELVRRREAVVFAARKEG